METTTVEQILLEKEYYYITPERYKGAMPAYFSPALFPECVYIKSKYPEIRREVEEYFRTVRPDQLKPGFIPHSSWDGVGWNSIGLYTFGFRRNKHCRQFPVLTSIVESIPSMTSAQISVIKPHSRLKAHIDDTSAVVRIHLGIKVPASLPQIGLRMKGREVSWREGELLVLSPIRPHYAWNETDEERIVVIIDIVHAQYAARKLRICGNVLAQYVMKITAARHPMLKRLPKPITLALHRTLGFGAYLVLLLRHSLKV
jgi:aspartyl/asparaginyl beta-hydroxylase (cupin superfamily)